MKSKIQGTFTKREAGPADTKILVVDKGYTEIKNELGQFRISVEIAMLSTT